MIGGYRRHLAFARLLSGALSSQAILSAASFAVGLILIRRIADAQYGLYILATNAILLGSSLQNALLSPSIANRAARLDTDSLGRFVSDLFLEQRRLLGVAVCLGVVLTAILWRSGLLTNQVASLLLACLVASVAVLCREFFRTALYARRRAQDVLGMDLLYALLFVTGALLASHSDLPAIVAVLMLGGAATVSAWFLFRVYRRTASWTPSRAGGLLRGIAPLALWSTAGAAIHWAFSQGYLYVVAGSLDMSAVAAIAATRLVMMPMNLLSAGLGSLMLPLASDWMHRYGAAVLRRRLLLGAAVLGIATIAYFVVLWNARQWVFGVLLHKAVPGRDTLLLLWAAIVFVMVMRDQLAYFMAVVGRFRALTLLTLTCATISLLTGYVVMPALGAAGALVGLLLGEVLSVAGILCLIHMRPVPTRTAAA